MADLKSSGKTWCKSTGDITDGPERGLTPGPLPSVTGGLCGGPTAEFLTLSWFRLTFLFRLKVVGRVMDRFVFPLNNRMVQAEPYTNDYYVNYCYLHLPYIC